MLDLTKLVTETRNENTMNLDQMTPIEICEVMNNEDLNVVAGVKEVLPQVAQAITWAAESLSNNGRIIYIGAGTSGRLGLLDSVECPPTFGVSPQTVVGLIAGGKNAFMQAVEGAEDKEELGIADLVEINCNEKDIVIGLAASGRTPYVLGAFKHAKKMGCRTVGIACNKNSVIGLAADLAIEPVNGPEVLTGSTRLKSGTSQKMILNMISTGSMVQVGKAYQNLMVDVMQTNEKLVKRAENIIMAATDCSREVASDARVNSGGQVKLAITMILLNCTLDQAKAKIADANGHIRKAI